MYETRRVFLMADEKQKSWGPHATANWKPADYVWFSIKCAFFSLAILYLVTYAKFAAVKAIYEAY